MFCVCVKPTSRAKKCATGLEGEWCREVVSGGRWAEGDERVTERGGAGQGGGGASLESSL